MTTVANLTCVYIFSQFYNKQKQYLVDMNITRQGWIRLAVTDFINQLAGILSISSAIVKLLYKILKLSEIC